MVAIKGHFDGKVIVPDEPLDLQPNQRLIVHVEPVTDHTTDFRSWIGLGNAVPQNSTVLFPSDNVLW